MIGQAIPIALIPILTRMFSPTDFGLLALYSAVISILGVVATGRYEIAIMLPEKDEDARALLQASVLIAMSISTVISIPIFIWNAELATLLGNEEIAPWLYLVPISVLLKGIYQALTYWNNRHKRFRHTAVSRVSQSGWQGVTQISLGYFKVFGGLIIGQVIGLFSSVIYLLGRENNHQRIFKNVSAIDIKIQVKKYDKLPKYSVLGGLCDSGATQMPILMLTQFYTSTVTGLFSLTFRILNVPTSIIPHRL
ncbi:lipopolysaccharide biosynthesis protein, partial [Salinivibrio sp. IB872]|uniref:lipopolysaccharide biosynthesis protein n=1 Tax=Salinivibrio sp. IB872 TaxID=1766123 RepID=UPI001F51AC44